MKRFGNRRDGKRVRDVDSLHRLILYIKPNRCDSDVFINERFDVTSLVKYYSDSKIKCDDLTYFHLFVTLIVKTIYNKPLLNRFIVNKNYYDRNDVSVGYAAKVSYEDGSKEVMSFVSFKEDDNLFTIKDKLINSVSNVRSDKELGANGVMNFVSKLPSCFISVVAFLVKFMDKHDLVPRSIVQDNLYYSSVIVSNLGSIKGGAIYHNLTDFGTNSIVVTIGSIVKEKVFINDKEEVRYVCDFGINIDERIADGVYFVKAIKLMQDILNNPKCLEGRVDEKILEATKFKY